MDILSTLNIPLHCLYSPFPKRGELQAIRCDKTLIGFSLKKLPSVNINKIYEYDTMKYSDEKLLNSILADFDKIDERMCGKITIFPHIQNRNWI